MAHLKFILVILIGLGMVILAVQNHAAMSTTVQFRISPVFWGEMTSGQVSVYQVAIMAFLFGVLLTGSYGMVERFRLKRQIKRAKKELQDKDKELSSLRNLPITADEVGTVESDSA